MENVLPSMLRWDIKSINNWETKLRGEEKRDMTQETLAAKIKVQPSTISNIERGETDTSVYTVYKIADAFKMHIKELFIFR